MVLWGTAILDSGPMYAILLNYHMLPHIKDNSICVPCTQDCERCFPEMCASLLWTRTIDPETWNSSSARSWKTRKPLGICKIRNNLLGTNISQPRHFWRCVAFFSWVGYVSSWGSGSFLELIKASLWEWHCHLFASGLWATDTGGSRAPIHPSGKRCTNVRRALRRVKCC